MSRILLAVAILGIYAFAARVDSERFVCRTQFHLDSLNLKESTIRIEPLLPPAFLASWFEGDLKRIPPEATIVTCDVYEYEHNGGHYTKLSCPEFGDVFVKTVLFSGDKSK